jgi:mono/diheme cytochrome c family protein
MRSFETLAFPLSLLALAALLLPTAALAGDAAAGKQTYNTVCFTCHGMTGKGDGPAGAALNPKPRDFSTGSFKYDANGDGTPGEDADLVLVIKNGAAKYGGSAVMAPWGYLSDSDIDNVVAYIRTLNQ